MCISVYRLDAVIGKDTGLRAQSTVARDTPYPSCMPPRRHYGLHGILLVVELLTLYKHNFFFARIVARDHVRRIVPISLSLDVYRI